MQPASQTDPAVTGAGEELEGRKGCHVTEVAGNDFDPDALIDCTQPPLVSNASVHDVALTNETSLELGTQDQLSKFVGHILTGYDEVAETAAEQS